jgi:hypothetical protein
MAPSRIPWPRGASNGQTANITRRRTTAVGKIVIALVVLAIASLIIMFFSHGGSFPSSLPG